MPLARIPTSRDKYCDPCRPLDEFHVQQRRHACISRRTGVRIMMWFVHEPLNDRVRVEIVQLLIDHTRCA